MPENKNQSNNHILGTEKIGKLLARLSIPAIIGLLVNSLYNLVDTLFIGQGVGALGIGGLTIAFPLQIFIMSIGIMLGVGTSSIISRSLGASNYDKANTAAGNALIISVFFGLILMIAGHIFIYPILDLFGVTDTIHPYAYQYLFVILFGAIFTSTAMTGHYIMMSEGRSKQAMISMVIGTGMNVILDPIFIFSLNMGIRGAALATVISQLLSLGYIIFYFLSGKSTLKISLHNILPNLSVISEIFKLGIAVFVRQSAKSFFFVIVNNSIKYYGSDMAISAFGIVFRLMAFMLIPIMGLGQGFQPIAGFNFGAKKYQRLKKAAWITILVISVFTSVVFFILMLFSKNLIMLFNNEEELISNAVPALRIIVLIIPLLGFHIVGSIYFFAVGKALPAFLLSLSRQVLFLIPLVIILPQFFGLVGIWAAFPIADLLSTAAATIWMFLDMHRAGMFRRGLLYVDN